MKKAISLLLIAVMCLSLTACGNRVEKMITEIQALENEELTLSDEKRVDELYKEYLALSDEEKAQITNFDILDAASKRVNFLSARKKFMPRAYSAVIDWVKSRLKTPSTMEVIKIEVYPSYNSMMEAFARIQFTSENAYGGKVEETYFVMIALVSADTFEAKWHYKGDAHATWAEVDWPEKVLQEIDFENKYIPNS